MSIRAGRRDVAYPLTIYFDGACPICRTEMTTLGSRCPAGDLVLADCSTGSLDAACVAAGLDVDDLSARIHARDASGRWLVGVDVFVAAYEAAGLTGLSGLFANRRLRPVWQRLYPWIARNRGLLARLGVGHLFRLLPRRTPGAARDASSDPCTGDRCRRRTH